MAPRSDMMDNVGVLPEEEFQIDVDLSEPADNEIVAEYVFDEEDLMDEEDSVDSITHYSNLAEFIDEEVLEELASELVEAFDADKQSRADWESIAANGVELLGFKIDEPDRPFAGAAGVSHPVLAQAVVKFQAKAYRELFPSVGPAKTRVLGNITPEKQDQALRVKEYLNYQTTCVMTEYGPQLDRLLFYTGLMGSAFKKTYYDYGLDRPTSRLVKAEDFVIDYYADDLMTAERYTHVMQMTKNELRKMVLSGHYRDCELMEPSQDSVEGTEVDEVSDEILGRAKPSGFQGLEPYTIYEMHVLLDLPGFEDENKLALPYVVTIEKDSEKILAIHRNWREVDPLKKKRVWFTHYGLIPGLGFYCYGYMHLIGGLAKTATSTLRQLVDAGTFANLPAGFKAHGLRVLAPDEPLSPGEWREANAPAGDLSKSLIPLPYKEPSPTLFNLMQFMVETAQQFADAADNVVESSSNYGPVGTTLALLEQSGKLFSAIHQRLHASQGQDLKQLAELNFEYGVQDYPYEPTGTEPAPLQQDFDPNVVDVIPVSDPNMPTEAHRVAKLNTILQVAMTEPNAHNMGEIRMDLYRALGVDQPERYMAQQEQPFTGDPIAENAAANMGKPLTVAPHQNDDAHIVSHAMMLENPAYKDNQSMKQTLMEHISAHLAAKYRKEMIALVAERDPALASAALQGGTLSPEVENQIAVAAMEMSDKLFKFDVAKQRILSGVEDDPNLRMQEREQEMRETEIRNKAMEAYRKAQIDERSVAVKEGQLALNEAKVILDDENADLDREVDIMEARYKARGGNNGNRSQH